MIATALLCYALVVHREARGESTAAQIAVAKTLMNRAAKSHKSACHELTKKRQFAFVRKYGLTQPNLKKVGAMDVKAWRKSRELARTFKAKRVRGITSKHVYFNTLKLGKRYRTKTTPVVLGKLIFY